MSGWTPDQPILEIENLSISFFTRLREIPAVMDFSTRVMAGEAMGLVGESGCGKSTVALGIMRDLGRTGRITGGRIRFKGQDLATMSEADLRRIRGSQIAMIYQEPMASLNPAMKIGAQLAEVPMIHEGMDRARAWELAAKMVADVRLPDPERILQSYPHQLSGGQQQRIVIAMALMSKPALLILDEPTTALDVTVEAGIVDLIKELGRTTGTAMLFISHNLGLVLDVCDRICVMYSGEAVETGRIEDVFDRMRHPYTQALFRSIPLPGADKTARPLVPIPGNFPLPHERPQGCNFGPRCSYFRAGTCDAAQGIAMAPVAGDAGHASRCARMAEINWSAPPAANIAQTRAPLGEPVLRVDALRKYYDVSSGMFGTGARRVVKANETLSFSARRGETLAIGRRSCRRACSPSTLHRPRRCGRPGRPPCSNRWGWMPTVPLAIRTNSRAASGSASPSRALSRWSRGCWCATNPPRRWMSRCRRRSSTCCATSRTGWAWPTCSSPTTSASFAY